MADIDIGGSPASRRLGWNRLGTMKTHLLRLKPRLVPRVWGGRRLAERFGARDAEPIGEAWMVYDENEVLEGPFAGRRLRDVLPALGPGFLGDRAFRRYGLELPLLVKLLDTAEWLSVQVHPDDAYAHAVEAGTGFHGKNEAWVVLDADPGAQIVYGVRRPVSRAELRAAAEDGSILELLNFVPVEPGDVIFVPAGTIHALGPGMLLYEVQQRSDLTYRLFDYGRGRKLHLEKALDVARLEPTPVQKTRLRPGTFLSTPFFTLSLIEERARAPEESFLTLVHPERAEPGTVLAAGGEAALPEGPWLAASL